MELFSLRKIHKICLRGCGPGPLVSAHGSTNFIKRRPLATGLTAQIKPSESVSWLFITDQTVVAAGSDRGRCGLALTAAHRG
jgi:hypothetical protein